TVRRTYCLADASTLVCICRRSYWKTSIRRVPGASWLDVDNLSRPHSHLPTRDPDVSPFLRGVPDADLGPAVHLSDGGELCTLDLEQGTGLGQITASRGLRKPGGQEEPFPRTGHLPGPQA